MISSGKDLSTPGPNDGTVMALMTTSVNVCNNGISGGDTLRADTAPSCDSSPHKLLKHQGEKTPDGNKGNYRVLWCTCLPLSTDYETLHDTFKECGKILRIKLKIDNNGNKYNGFITFDNHDSAMSAYNSHNGKNIGNSVFTLKIMKTDNLLDEEFDFIPKLTNNNSIIQSRPKPNKVWYIASYEKGKENMIRGVETLEKKVGGIPVGNIKRYGKNILVKAGNRTQATLLSNFCPTTNGNIAKVEEHRTFNINRGVIYRCHYPFLLQRIST